MKTARREYPRAARIVAAAFFMTALTAAFFGFSGTARLPLLQLGPALLRCAAAFSAGALATVLAIVLATLLFGRFYCAVFCPLGILQDLAGWLSRRRCRRFRDPAASRILTAGLAYGMLAAGWTLPFLLLDPYSNFGRMLAGNFALGGMLPAALVLALAVWKKRIYCVALCPVGALLGFFARHGVFKLRLSEKCVKCGACAQVCPSGCIDPAAGELDNGRCVRCLNCVSRCRFGGVGFVRSRRRERALPVDPGRRELLLCGGLLLGALGAGVLARRGAALLPVLFRRHLQVLPPGAGDAARFSARCTACQLCTANCPAGIIVPAPGGDGPVALDLERGACRYDCDRCSQICPTGALAPLTLGDKRRTRIALAAFDPGRCLVFQEGMKCGRCAGVCPTGAVTLRRSGAPRFNPASCIGCGACRAVCPAPGKAFSVTAVERQTRLEG